MKITWTQNHVSSPKAIFIMDNTLLELPDNLHLSKEFLTEYHTEQLQINGQKYTLLLD